MRLAVDGDREECRPLVSVVVPTRNAAVTLDAQLAAVVPQAVALRAEVIVVDNASSDGTAGIVEAWAARVPTVHLVRCARVGVNPARNAGVRASRSELIVLCDADDVAAEGWLAAMYDALTAQALVGGPLDGSRLNSEFIQDVRAPDQPRRCALPTTIGSNRRYAPGGNMGFRRAVFDAIGGFDESFPTSGGDEVDFCWRAQDAGFLLVPACDAVMYVRWRDNLPDLARQTFRLARGNSYLYRKHIDLGSVPRQTRRTQLAMFKAYWRRIRSAGPLNQRVAQWRITLRVSWIAGSLVSVPRTRVLV